MNNQINLRYKLKLINKLNLSSYDKYLKKNEIISEHYQNISNEELFRRIFTIKKKHELFYYVYIPTIIAIVFGVVVTLIFKVLDYFNQVIVGGFIGQVKNLLLEHGYTLEAIQNMPDQTVNNSINKTLLFLNALGTISFIPILLTVILVYLLLRWYLELKIENVMLEKAELEILEALLSNKNDDEVYLKLISGSHELNYKLQDYKHDKK